jgi:hypothetical protein
MIYTAPYIMLLMRENLLRGQVGRGWNLEIETFALGECHLGPKKSRLPGPPAYYFLACFVCFDSEELMKVGGGGGGAYNEAVVGVFTHF